MSNIKFNWDKVMKDSAYVMAQCITKGKYISTITELYYEIKSYYENKGEKVPTFNTYRQNLSKRLNSSKNKVSIKTALYQLAGQYDKMTLPMLAENITVSTDGTADNCNWLFVRFKRYEHDYGSVQKHFYFLSHELKKKFSKEIIFISYDNDTIVILCSNDKARKHLLRFFTSQRIQADQM